MTQHTLNLKKSNSQYTTEYEYSKAQCNINIKCIKIAQNDTSHAKDNIEIDICTFYY